MKKKIIGIFSILYILSFSSVINLVSAVPHIKQPPIDRKKDSDLDGLTDWWEIFMSKTNPNKRDTDEDGMWDYYEVFAKFKGGWQDPLVKNERYAILFFARPDHWHCDKAIYWNQLVKMYDTLIKGYNYKPENIFVFYAEGKYPNEGYMDENELKGIIPGSIESHLDMIDFIADDFILQRFLENELEQVITENDSLLFWVYGDGDLQESEVWGTETGFWSTYRTMPDWLLYNILLDYNYAQLTFIIGTSHSGGFLDPSLVTGTTAKTDSDELRNLNDLKGNVLIMTSQDSRESHTRFINGFIHQFHKSITPYFNWQGRLYISYEILMFKEAYYKDGHKSKESADLNHDNLVSMREAFLYAEANNQYSYNYPDNLYYTIPQYYESSPRLGERTFL